MKPEFVEYVRFRIEQANETLRDAKSLYETGTLHGVINRLYYACFYGVLALLFTEGASSKKHTGILSLLDRDWVKTGRLSPDSGRFLRRLFDLRLQADYGYPLRLERDDVAKWLRDGEHFLNEVLARVDEWLSSAQQNEAGELHNE